MTSSELRTDRERERRRKSETLLTPLTGNCPIPVLDLGSWILDLGSCGLFPSTHTDFTDYTDGHRRLWLRPLAVVDPRASQDCPPDQEELRDQVVVIAVAFGVAVW